MGVSSNARFHFIDTIIFKYSFIIVITIKINIMKNTFYLFCTLFLLFGSNRCYSNYIAMNQTRTIIDTGKVSLSLGANLDLSDGITLNTFYGRISFLCHNICKSEKGRLRKNILSKMGIYAGLYQSKYISTEGIPSGLNYYYNQIGRIDQSNYLVERSYSSLNSNSSFNNYGLVLTLPFNITNQGLFGDGIKHNVYFTPFDFEAVMTKETIAYTFEDIHKDTISVTGPVLDSLHVPFTVNRSFVNYYWGFTNFQYNYEGNKYIFFIKATPLGISWMGGASRPCFNYSFYFGISENKFGIRIGGEFKGNYGSPDPYFNC